MPSLSPIWGRYVWARVREQTVRFGAGPAGMDRERPTLDMDLIGGLYSKWALIPTTPRMICEAVAVPSGIFRMT